MIQLNRGRVASMPSGFSRYSQRKLATAVAAIAAFDMTANAAAIRQDKSPFFISFSFQEETNDKG